MLDPFRLSTPASVQAPLIRFANDYSLPTLPLHAHEVLFALALYEFIARWVSPPISSRLFPNTYPKLDVRTKLNWGVKVVSFVQSCVVNTLSLYTMFFDEERKAWNKPAEWEKRIWGYTGFTGLTQSLALGYFLWDIYMCARYVHIFGWGFLVHAIASSAMFVFGFRPFIHFYCPVFLLHELSTPFLNIHWFCDKIGQTGSIYQAVNGAFLIFIFFCCRLVWGTYGSVGVFNDVYRATTTGYTTPRHFHDKLAQLPNHGDLSDPLGQTTAFMTTRYLPLWLGASYLVCNVALALLNFYWFSKMIQAVRSRFDPPISTPDSGFDGDRGNIQAPGKDDRKKEK